MSEPLREFEVRHNCEYILRVEAASEDEARDLAAAVPKAEWSQAWSSLELEWVDPVDPPAETF